MSGHTPGPWRVWEVDDSSWEICETDNPSRHSHFARVKVGNMWGEEGKANARLIASAPELLEACRALIETMQAAIKSGDWKVDGACDPDADLARARAAIAKATGAAP